MSARVETAWLETRMLRPAAAEMVSPQLVAAIDDLSAYSLRDTVPTLEDLRLALQGTGFTWSGEGELAFSSERAALIDEMDELIEVFGRDAQAAYLFPSILAAAEEPVTQS